ncbi:uncharacterized protein PHALS_04379 [Plasmopara halstedii]|uniref:Uncharacterized protein n=1 Tax=Plasmopara halstedii TaxID=4781 RepID=A0A0P1B036_PLAHL|nr:uncharacterized protein PHALS_04379 [Plasmopara halstedii]CEG47511.1 hypothetical protein PHALS_04379 [Plasmopara halstedii]|eukprot:XP_024583880.1 hypothetical protein PHALS_04379 [Plasmopara halstedii]
MAFDTLTKFTSQESWLQYSQLASSVYLDFGPHDRPTWSLRFPFMESVAFRDETFDYNIQKNQLKLVV